MVAYGNCHFALEALRAAAAAAKTRGPVVMVVGGPDTGKSTLARLLVNYAARQGRRPLLADLDSSRGGMAMPGAIGLACVQQPVPLAEGSTSHAPYVRMRTRRLRALTRLVAAG